MPESLALTMQRTPATKPMPAMTALVKPVLGGGRYRARSLFERAHSRNQRQHPGAIGLVGIAGRRDRRFKDGHGYSLPSSFRDCVNGITRFFPRNAH
jgi:hypothetical protein